MWPFGGPDKRDEIIADLRQQINNVLSESRRTLATQLSESQEALSAKEQKLTAKEQELAAVRATLEQERRATAHLRQQTEAQLQTARATLEQEKSLSSRLHKTIAELQEQVAGLREQVAGLQEEVTESKMNIITAVQSQRKEAEEHHAAVQGVREDMRTALHDQKMAALDTIRELKAQHAGAMDAAAKEQSALEHKFTEERLALENKIAELNGQITALENEVDVATQANVKLASRMSVMQMAFNNAVVGSKTFTNAVVGSKRRRLEDIPPEPEVE